MGNPFDKAALCPRYKGFRLAWFNLKYYMRHIMFNRCAAPIPAGRSDMLNEKR